MKKNLVKMLAVAGTAVLAMSALAGCGSGSGTADTTAAATAAPVTEAASAEGSAEDTTAGNAEKTEAASAAETAGADLKGSISMVGSTSMEKFATALSEVFMEKYPNVTVQAEFVGSGAGVEAVSGGADQPIVVVGRESGSGTRSAFEEILKVEDACKYSNELDSTGAVMAKVASTPGAIGYVSLDVLDDTVKTVNLEGVEATPENIKAGTYFLSRPFVMATKGEISEQNDVVQAVFNFIYSEEGTELVKSVGLIPAN